MKKQTTLIIKGEANYQIEVESYSFLVSLKEIIASQHPQEPVEQKNLTQLEKMYYDKLKAIGIDFGQFKRNDSNWIHSAPYSHPTDVCQLFYNYITTSKDEATKIVNLKMNGLAIVLTTIAAKEKTNEELATLTLDAVEDAKLKATIIADNLNKKVKDIVKIENSDTKKQYLDVCNPDEIQKHCVTVTFTIEQ